MKIEIRQIDAKAALAVRHQVLWPERSPDYCRIEGDEEALHLGGFVEGHLVSVLSLFDQAVGWHLRKFATLPDWQGQGVGSALFREALDHAGDRPLWLNARMSAIGFYQRFDLQPIGAPFQRPHRPGSYQRLQHRRRVDL